MFLESLCARVSHFGPHVNALTAGGHVAGGVAAPVPPYIAALMEETQAAAQWRQH